MKLLLDTSTLLWATLHPEKLTERVRALILDDTSEIFVSAASAWEIATKVRIGRLPEAFVLEERFLDIVVSAGYVPLSIDMATSLRAARLSGEHRDPFDRMIAAHSLQLDMPVLSNDQKLDGFGVHRIW